MTIVGNSTTHHNTDVLLAVPFYADRISMVAQTTVGPPLGLAYLAAELENRGVRVSILDANALRLSDEEVRRRIVELKPRILGLTAVTPTVDQCAGIAAQVKKNLPETTVLLGGPHATAAPVETLEKFDAFDYLVKGEAEFRLPQMIDALKSGKNLLGFDGVAYKDEDGRVVDVAETGDRVNVNETPLPARHLLPMNLYTGPDGGRLTTMAATRGCPAHCTYCLVPSLFGRKLRARDPENVVGEMNECLARYKTVNFNFIDDTFTFNKNWVYQLCEAIRQSGLQKKARWLCLTRADTIDRELLAAMKAAGCFKIEFGIESGDEEMLRKIKKGITTTQSIEAFKMARDLGLETLGFVIIFSPEENRESLEKTRRLIFKADPDTLQMSFCTPFPGTAIEREIQEKGLKISGDWSRFIFLKQPVFEHPNFSYDQMIAWQTRMLRAFYFRPQTVFRLLLSTWRKGGWGGFLRSAFSAVRSLLSS